MTKRWICLFALAAATGFLVSESADHASALSIKPMADHRVESSVVMINCKTGTKHCSPSTGLQQTLQNKLKTGGGQVGGGELCGNTPGQGKCAGPSSGNCASDDKNCGDAFARRAGGQNGVSTGPARVATAPDRGKSR